MFYYISVCKDNEFECANKEACVPAEDICDGRKHCDDKSDERDCSKCN